MKAKSPIIVLLPIVVILGGVGSIVYLVKTKPKAKAKPVDERGVLVEVEELSPSSERVEVVARGTVVPARQVILSPEVGGRVVSMSPTLVPGGVFKAGETVLRVDARDYRLALEQQYAAVNRAETELTLERSRKNVAEKEWQKFGSKNGGAASPLATRVPQLKSAQVAVKSAESGLKQARLRVSRTTIKAPFNGIVRTREVEMGQLVAPGAPIAVLVGTDEYWVQVSVPISQLTWFDIPGIGGAEKGATVEVRQRVGERTDLRTGHVVRLLGEVDPAGRMARVLVEIPDPLSTSAAAAAALEKATHRDGRLPLLLGSYVEVAITAGDVDGVFRVSRASIRDGDKVFIMKADNTLAIRDVDILWRRPQEVLVGAGIAAGERIVTSPIPAPVDGMLLRLKGQKADAKSTTPEPKDTPPTEVPATKADASSPSPVSPEPAAKATGGASAGGAN